MIRGQGIRHSVHRASILRLRTAGRAAVVALLALGLYGPFHAAAEEAIVATDGGCLRLRAMPSIDATVLTCLPQGAAVDAQDEWAEVDGYRWRRVGGGGREGWVASEFLVAQSAPAETPALLPAPPAGGLTVGRAGTSSVDDLIAAQPFEVSAIFVLDVASQQFRVHNVLLAARLGPTAFALSAETIVLARRISSDSGSADTPIAYTEASSPQQLQPPPRGGLTAGIPGTCDLSTLIAAQPFTVDLVTTWEVSSQRWLIYRPDAPAFTNSLTGLTPSTPVFLRRHPTAPDPEPPPVPPQAPAPSPVPADARPGGAGPREERITYYYCERGENPAWWGDGGGWCGAMASGELVHDGAASCARHLMGQRFLIAGDPLERPYTCKDTGGGVFEGHRDIWFRDSDSARLWWMDVGSTAVVIPLD